MSVVESDKGTRAYFCPNCQSPAVDTQELLNEGTCRACKKTGNLQDFFVYIFKQDQGTPAMILNNFSRDLQRAIQSKLHSQVENSFMADMLFILDKWGFLDVKSPDATAKAKLYMTNIARHIVKAVILTRDQIEQEEQKQKEEGVANA